MSPPAPVVLFTFNRPRHTALALDALRANPEACQSRLIVFSDGPSDDKDLEEIAEVRRLISATQGFRDVILVQRERNLGLANSIIQGVTEVCASYGRAIVLEDDIVVSPYFLDYVNSALQLYEEEERIISIGCYTFPVFEHLPETFFLNISDCWGWAVWKRAWDLFEPDGAKLLAQIRVQGLEERFDLEGAYPYTRMLAEQTMGQNDSWAIRWYAKAFLLNKLTLYPGRSVTRNIGMDASGIHGGRSSQYEVGIAREPIRVYPVAVEEHAQARAAFSAFLRRQRGSFFQRSKARFSGLLERGKQFLEL
jgi:Glycosyl transferase family 2